MTPCLRSPALRDEATDHGEQALHTPSLCETDVQTRSDPPLVTEREHERKQERDPEPTQVLRTPSPPKTEVQTLSDPPIVTEREAGAEV